MLLILGSVPDFEPDVNLVDLNFKALSEKTNFQKIYGMQGRTKVWK